MFSLASSPFAPSLRQAPAQASPLTPRSHNATRAWHAPSKMFMMPPSPPETPSRSDKSSENDENTLGQIFFPLQESSFSISDENTTRPSLVRPPRRESLNPLNRGADVRRGERRRQYLGRVREARDEARLDLRGEHMLHHEFLEQQREWESWLARNAPQFEPEEEEMELVASQDGYMPMQRSHQVLTGGQTLIQSQGEQQIPSQFHGGIFSQEEQDEVDAILTAEEREMQELIAMQEESAQDDLPVLSQNVWDEATNARDIFSSSPVYGSEDDEFDQLLLGISQGSKDGQDNMDMSGD